MIYRDLAATARASAGWCVALLGFAIPVSTALDGVLLALTLIACLFAAPSSFREWLRLWVRLRAALLSFLVFGALLLAALYSPVPWRTAWSSASKYLDLALIPLLIWAVASPIVRVRALYCFIAAIALSLAVSYGSAIGLWNSLPGLHTLPHYPVGFKLSVTHNLLVSLAAFVALLLARDLRATRPRAAFVALALALVCMHNVLFIVIGRTGYVVLAVLLTYFAITVARDRRSILLALLIITALFAGAYGGSQYFPARVQDIASELVRWKPGIEDETSVGQRLGYYRTTVQIIAEHPLTGVGTGAFAEAYADKVRGTPAPATVNPHNDYLMIAAQAGLPALALLIALYVVLWRDAPRLGSPLERDLMRGLVLTMAIGGLFNTLLMDHAEGLLFAWATALLYAGRALRSSEANAPTAGVARESPAPA